MARALDTTDRLARLETSLEHVSQRLDEGFDAMAKQFFDVGQTLDKINSYISTQDKTLTSLVESRERTRRLMRWAGGVVTAVLSAAVLVLLGLK